MLREKGKHLQSTTAPGNAGSVYGTSRPERAQAGVISGDFAWFPQQTEDRWRNISLS